MLNVTAVQPTSIGNLRVYPDGGEFGGTLPPNSSSINYIPGRDIPNLVVVGLVPVGVVDFWSDSPGKVNIVADVIGYITAPVK